MSRTSHLLELDVLRSQVADLSRRLAERDRSAQDLREQSAMLHAIVEGTATETDEEFFADAGALVDDFEYPHPVDRLWYEQ